MQVVALLVVVLLAGLLIGRLGGGPPAQPGPAANPIETTRQVKQASEAASRAEQQRLNAAMKMLR